MEKLPWRQGSSGYRTALRLRISGFDSERESVLVPDPNQVEEFSQQDVQHLVHTTTVLTISSGDASGGSLLEAD